MAGLFTRYPRAANIVSTGVLFGTGDIIAQLIESQKNSHAEKVALNKDEPNESQSLVQSLDLSRVARATFYGSCVFGPLASTVTFPLLNKVGAKLPIVQRGLFRMAIDQGIFAPFVYIPMYFGGMALLEQKGIDGAIARVKNSWLEVWKANALVWAPVQVLNFTIVPPALRLVLSNCVGVVWGAYLAATNKKGAHDLLVPLE